MGWSVEQVRKRRQELGLDEKGSPAGTARTAGTAKTAGTTKTAGTAAHKSGKLKLTEEEQKKGEAEWTQGTRRALGTVKADAGSVGDAVLAAYTGGKVKRRGTPTGAPVSDPGKLDVLEDYEPGYNYVGKGNTTAQQRAILAGTEGKYAQKAQQLRQSFARNDAPGKEDDGTFDKWNAWMDSDPRNRELVRLIRSGKNVVSYAETDHSMVPGSGYGAAASAGKTVESRTQRQEYTDKELIQKGYSRKQIVEARQYAKEFYALPAAARAVRRTANTIAGVGETVAAGAVQFGEQAVQGAKDIAATLKNERALNAEVGKDERKKKLKDLMGEVDMDYKPLYTDADLEEMGYSSQEVEEMRRKLAGVEVKTAIDPDKSVGYQLYRRGQDLTGAAQAGLANWQRQALGVVTSAGENLTVAAMDPAMVLPVLSAQGAAESMGASTEKGETAGKSLAGGLAKFGAGWAINSVGAADLARSMGSDYAKNTLAGKLADAVRGMSGNSEFAQAYPAVANAISGGVDNAMQAFVETYADTAIDAALGDEEQAKALFEPETFLAALESGLSGGASGALGGAVGTGLAKMHGGDASLAGNIDRSLWEMEAREDLARVRQAMAQQQKAQQRVQEPEAAQMVQRDPAAEDAGEVYGGPEAPAVQLAQEAESMEPVRNAEAESTEGAESAVRQRSEGVQRTETARSGENTGESVEKTRNALSGTREVRDTEGVVLRETPGLMPEPTLNQKRGSVQRELSRWKVSRGAAETISRNIPAGVTDAARYAAAANSMYRLGQMSDVKSFERALELAGTGSGIARNVNYVLAQQGGETALRAAFVQGQGELEAGTAMQGVLGGALSERSTSGAGRVYYEGSMREEGSVGNQLIRLNAQATGTDAVLKDVLQHDTRVRAYMDSATGRIFFADSAGDVFGTILHEDNHWYNSWDAEGAKQFQEHALLYLAKSEGYETVDEMIRGKMADYARQELTYNEAAEELVGDALREVFGDKEGFRAWVKFQAAQAEKNAGKSGAIRKAMDTVKGLLENVLQRAKEVLETDPENRAALRAKRLAQEERQILQKEFFEHAGKAMDNLRAAKENAGAVQRTGEAGEAGKPVRYQLAEQADREAKRNEQQMASRAIADKAAALDTLGEFFGITRGVRVSQDSLDGLALRWTKTTGSRTDRVKLAKEARALVEYLKAEGADMTKAQALAETLAGEVLEGATYRNSELWDQYPDLHKLEYTVNKTGKAKAELVKQYGSWGEAVAQARKHGVMLRQAEGVRDGNPAEVYESLINDESATGYLPKGESALWKSAAERAGVADAMSMESTEWLQVLMSLHDAIKPRMMSRFEDEAEYEDAKVDLAGRMIGDLMQVPEMTDAQAIFEGIQKYNRDVARMYAGTEERAAEVDKGLKPVEKYQRAEFDKRLRKNTHEAAANTEEAAQARKDQRAERLLNKNLEALGVEVSSAADLGEKMTLLTERYERLWKEEKKRLRRERQEMLDDAKLEIRKLRSEKNELERQVQAEQRRADKAEYAQIVQEREIMEWEVENQRKAQAWQQKQAQRNAIANEVARQQRDEDVAIAKALAEKRVQRARDARKADELKRGIRRNAAQLNQMVLRPAPEKYVPKSLISEAAEVAKLADLAVLNNAAAAKLDTLRRSIQNSAGNAQSPNAMTEDWAQSRVPEMIDALQNSLKASKEGRLAKLQQQLTEAEALPDSEKARMLQDRLRMRIREAENRTYMSLNVEQLQMLKAITSSALHVIRHANKTLSLAKAEEVDAIAQQAAVEVLNSKGNPAGASKLRNLATRYNLEMLGAKRVMRMLGGYAKDGQMEKLADMLNEGQHRQTRITVEGTHLFDEVTGEKHLKELERFAGPGAELVDIGLTDSKGKRVKLNHAQLCSLYMHLQNADSRYHLMEGGMVLPDMELYSKGDVERAYQQGQTVKLGMLTDPDRTPTADTILNKVESAMDQYDRSWCEIMKTFYGEYTQNLINETSMKLLGYNRAVEKDYYPIAVDKSVLATQIEGLKLDGTIEGRGFLKERKKSGLPILLEECTGAVQRSLRDVAAYAGLAAPIRDVQKVLNCGVETADGLGILKNRIIKERWGQGAVDYIDYLLTDLQSSQRKRSSMVSRAAGRLRGNYAGAVLTLNPGVAIAQAASLPTAGAVLGSDTMAAVIPFVKNLSPSQRKAMEAEIRAHGDVLLEYRLRGTTRGELASAGKTGTLAQEAMDKLPKALTGWINQMDEITVAALWEGSKRYVENHKTEFGEETIKTGSEEYWKAVNRTYQKVIEETQPNYTAMQRAGIQRNPDELSKTLTMFTTQRFQNYGIIADAVMDYNAQKARYEKKATAETRAEMQRAGAQLRRVAASQVTQTAVFALMKMGADFLMHRWDREQDENGDVTMASLLKRFAALFLESAAGNAGGGSEIFSLVSNAVNGKDYDVISVTSIGAVNELFTDVVRLSVELRKDTSEMKEEQLEEHHQRLLRRALALMEDGMEIAGVPFGNGRKFVEAFRGYWEDIQNLRSGGEFSFNSVPESATGQYDRLYNAYETGDREQAQAALEKLDQMDKSDKVYSQLKTRLEKYDPDVQAAAQAQVRGDEAERERLSRKVILRLYETLGLQQGDPAGAGAREAVIDCVTGAVNALTDAELKGGKDRVTEYLEEALDRGDAGEVQEEYDRLRRAGKSEASLKSKITAACKPEYLAGSKSDREKLEKMLLELRDAEGKPLYSSKTIRKWTEAAKSGETRDGYEDLR